ncbi:30S ribosomal protein S17 [Candidatus Daviesbacteria bacterium]|nr:30S ribosomal protein S17 [Candidatus Daviesbacteria bacterium]
MIGRVVSIKSKSTATVLVERQSMSRLYGKTFVRSKKYLVDDPLRVKDGDMVEIEQSRPQSKRKHWRIIKVLGKNIAELAKAHLKKKGEEAIAQVMPEEKETEESSELSRQTEGEVNKKQRKSKVRKEKSES